MDHQNKERVSHDWQKQPFTKIRDIRLCGTSERHASSNKDPVVDNPCHQLPAYQTTCTVQSNSLTITKTNAEVPLPQKRRKYSQKVQKSSAQGCQQWGRASQKESTQRQQERKKKTALVNRLKAQRPEECCWIQVLPTSFFLSCWVNCFLGPADSPFPVCCSALTDGRWGSAPWSPAVHGLLLCDRGAGCALQPHMEEKGWAL